MPMMSAPCASTKPDAGVIATRPATAPEIMPNTDGFLAISHSANIQPNAAAAVAICVAAAAVPADPQQGGADDAEHQIVRRHILGAQADTLAQNKTGDQTRGAGVQMHDG